MNSITTDVAIKQGMQVLIHSGVPVATTEQLAGYYGCTKNNIKKNYSCNAARFTEGKHYFVISGSVLKGLKDSVTFGNSVDKRAPKLTLWTQRGAARHAKMLETDRAWEVFESLEDCYFSRREKSNAPRKSTTEERTPLRDAVNMLVSKRHLMYPEAYALIHQRFQVTTLEHLTPEQIAPAVEYVHRVILEGELLERQNEQLSLPISYPMEYFDQYRWMNGINEESLSAPWRYPASLHANGDSPNPLGKMLNEMQQMGYEVDAALFQLSSLQHHLTAIRSKLRRIQAEVR